MKFALIFQLYLTKLDNVQEIGMSSGVLLFHFIKELFFFFSQKNILMISKYVILKIDEKIFSIENNLEQAVWLGVHEPLEELHQKS